MTFGVVDRIIILGKGYTAEIFEFTVVCVGTVHPRTGRWFVIHLGGYNDSRFQRTQSFTLTSVVESRKITTGHVSGRSRRYSCVLVRFDWVFYQRLVL